MPDFLKNPKLLAARKAEVRQPRSLERCPRVFCVVIRGVEDIDSVLGGGSMIWLSWDGEGAIPNGRFQL